MTFSCYLIHGDICYSEDKDHLIIKENQYLICDHHKCMGVTPFITERYKSFPVFDYTGMLILPGLTDLHIHAPQYAYRALGMDLELIDWLNQRTFPEEEKYEDTGYAKAAYQIFADTMKRSATTRACIFATIHVRSTQILMQAMEKTGLITYVGKVSMDRNAPEKLREGTVKEAIKAVEEWLDGCSSYKNTRPILTPRFIPSCTEELLLGLKKVQEERNLPVQSHLSEAVQEVEWVTKLCPKAAFYGDAYDQAGLFGGEVKTVMAHCVFSDTEEVKRMKERGVFIAHCPSSNTNLRSGIAPVKKYLTNKMYIGLGSDVAGGTSESIFCAMADAISVSKLRTRYVACNEAPITMEEAFYLGTMGGGQFFGKVGSFLPGYELDAVVIDDSKLLSPLRLTVRERLERAVYLSERCKVVHKFVAGNQLF